MNNNLIIISVILLSGVFAILWKLRDNRKKERKFRKAVNRIDILDRVKPGEIDLKRKQKGGK